MTVIESLQLERSKNLNEIILFKEGSWWRAYEESAFICHNYNYSSQLKDDEKLKPTHRKYKDIDDSCIFVGFPIKSISKYLPGIENYTYYNEDMSILTIDVSEFLDPNIDIRNEYIKWKNYIPLKTKEKTPKENNQNNQSKNNDDNDRYMKMVMLAQEIISYPIENKTMIENIMFISNLKQKFINII